MLQILQYQKTGEMKVEEVPAPECFPGGILVRTEYSLISAGTEKISVENAQSSMLQRAKKQPDQVKLVRDFIKKEGFLSTLKRVRAKLDSYKVLGYSASGVVIESECDEFVPGDRVACAGAGFANHSEIISIPKNLAAKIPDDVSFEDASYTTVASIAMQGVRQADVRLGETVAVIGLGLIGQITIQLLKSAGCRVVGLDINESSFDNALKFGCDAVYLSNSDSVKSIYAFAKGLGCDAVLITASTPSNEPVELALKLTRKKGRIVIVGAVGMNLPRSPFYEKELDIKISCSYGPGRYDTNYEIEGNDYPSAYVRWTENRNMQSVLDLILQKKLDVKSLTTHVFEIEKAQTAYDLVTGKVKEPFLGILIHYAEKETPKNKFIQNTNAQAPKSSIGLGFIGAGAFAQTFLLPALKNTGIDFSCVSNAIPVDAISVAKQFGFKNSTSDSSELIKREDINLIFCATHHDTHAKYVIEAIEAGKPVYVEKPLAISSEELEKIDEAVTKHDGSVMVGFNRRFSKSFKLIDDFFKMRHDPMVISYRVNAGYIPKSNWSQQEKNGGRIIGEVCHFIDCMVYLTKSLPVKVYAESISSNNSETKNHDNVIITIKFSDGSVGVVEYLANGDSALPKEYCEVFCENSTALMNNFQSVELMRVSKVKKISLDGKKGHNEEVIITINAVKKGENMPIPYNQIRAVTLATFAAELSLSKGMPVEINLIKNI
ncbi:MAG: bi-domain-containing oxidoreductase [FCB group bacterium]|jgi:polar amino acid transport system substrate-binding protein